MRAQVLKDIEHCVKCGGCKAVCPTYESDPIEGMSARGRVVLVKALAEGLIGPSEVLNERLFSCLLCGFCEGSCPVGVKITEAIYEGRAALTNQDPKRATLRMAAAFLLKRPGLAFSIARAFRFMIPLLHKAGVLPMDVPIAPKPFLHGFKLHQPSSAQGRVAVFTGCGINYMYPHLGDALVRVLLKNQYEVVLPPGEVCCGAPLRALGLTPDAKELANRNMEHFGTLQCDAVVSLCPTCVVALKHGYPALIGEGLPQAMDISEFLHGRVLIESALKLNEPVAYHPPCHLEHSLGVRKQPRELMKAMDIELMQKGAPSCCGFGLAFTHPAMSEGILLSGESSYEGASTLVTACPGCMMQLQRRHGNVVHLIELIDQALSR